VSAGLATIITFPAGLGRFLPGRAASGSPAPAASGSPAPAASGPPAPAASGSRAPRRAGSSGLGPLEASLMLVLGPIAALVIRLSVTRARECRADAAGAMLSGDPAALATALRKVDAGAEELALAPDGRLTSVGHLMIACPFRPDGFARLFLTHPPAGERVRRLEALAGYRR